jgi:hydroxymethylpyrimidine pyrophosphatase-like HAD family hydrolase
LSRPTAAIFDIDRTLLDPETNSLFDGLDNVIGIETRQFAVTEITGRSLPGFQSALADNPQLLPSHGVPLGIEYGTRLVLSEDYTRATAYQTISHQELCFVEQQSIAALASDSSHLQYVAFYPEDLTARRIYWSPTLIGAATLEDIRSEAIQVYHGTADILTELLQEHNPSKVTCRFTSDIPKLPVGMQTCTYKYGGGYTCDLMPGSSDKAVAACAIIAVMGLAPEDTVIAGDSLNDKGMLTLDSVHSILVRSPKTDATLFPAHIHRVKPKHLGKYLGNLSL